MMGGPYFEPAAYPALPASSFGPTSQYRVTIHNQGRTVSIGDHTDHAFRIVHALVHTGSDAVDVAIHGLPGRFIDQLGGRMEIPVPVVAELLESVGIKRGTPLRFLTCHADEPPLTGATLLQLMLAEWGGSVSGPNGLL